MRNFRFRYHRNTGLRAYASRWRHNFAFNIKGEQDIQTYTFNTGVAKHTFCRFCGIKPFYTPRSNPDGIDINVRCLDTKPNSVSVVKFDGEHWEDNANTLAYKSEES